VFAAAGRDEGGDVFSDEAGGTAGAGAWAKVMDGNARLAAVPSVARNVDILIFIWELSLSIFYWWKL
jgi:hypothetical protein